MAFLLTDSSLTGLELSEVWEPRREMEAAAKPTIGCHHSSSSATPHPKQLELSNRKSLCKIAKVKVYHGFTCTASVLFRNYYA